VTCEDPDLIFLHLPMFEYRDMRRLHYAVIILLAAFLLPGCSQPGKKGDIPRKPNIVWIVAEDMSDNWSCYGENTIQTPNIDKLAGEGELFENAYITAPVCSPSRSAMITGMYQTTIGAHNHRSQRKEGKGGGNEEYYESYRLPGDIPFLPRLFKEAGYYTVLGNDKSVLGNEEDVRGFGKTDYNFEFDRDLYDDNDWKDRQSGQPFFAQIQLRGGKFRNAPVDNPVDPNEVNLPPYYPDDEILRKDWAEYLNSVLYLDQQVKEIIDRLKRENIYDKTAVFLFTDHGISHLRAKQFLYEDGIKIPLVVKCPGLSDAGNRRKDLVSQIDISATSLYLAGIPIPDAMQGRSFYGEEYRPQEYIFAARDRCDETVDLIRAVSTGRFKYIANFFPHKPHVQPNTYKDGKEIIQHMRQLYANDMLKKETERYFKPERPVEELYDLENDPFELNNLAGNDTYRDTLQKMRNILISTILETKDLGFIPEPILEEMGKKYGNKYYILQQPENSGLIRECMRVLRLDEQGEVEELQKALSDKRPSIRFWAAYGLGNIPELPAGAVASLKELLEDESDAVKIAAARALCRTGHTEPALHILSDNLENSNLITGMYATLFIEDLNEEMIEKIMPAIEKAKDGPYEFTRRIAVRISNSHIR